MARAWLRAGAWRARARRGKAALATAAIALVSVLQPLAVLETGPTCRKGVPRAVCQANPATAMPGPRARPAIWCGLPKPITPVSRPLRGLSRQIAGLFLLIGGPSRRRLRLLPSSQISRLTRGAKTVSSCLQAPESPDVSKLQRTPFQATLVAIRLARKQPTPGEHLPLTTSTRNTTEKKAQNNGKL